MKPHPTRQQQEVIPLPTFIIYVSSAIPVHTNTMTDSSSPHKPSSTAPHPASPKLLPTEETTPLILSTTAPTLSPVAADENTPLISQNIGLASGGSHTPPTRSKSIYVLTLLSLIFSAVIIALIGACSIITGLGNPGLPWQVQNCISAVIVLVYTLHRSTFADGLLNFVLY